VTSRLEDVATATTGAPLISQSSTEAVHHAMASHAPVAAADAPTPAAAPTLNQDASGSPATKGYQNDVIGGPLQEYLQKSEEVGGLVAEQVRACS
jgi:adenylyl cyclase-associated protein